MDDGCTLGSCGYEDIKSVELDSIGDPITKMVRITGGIHALSQIQILIFKSPNPSQPIRGVPHKIPDLCYRSSAKGSDGRSGLERVAR